MTEVAPPPSTPAPSSSRSDGFHVATWVAVVVGLVFVGGVAFALGWVVGDRHGHNGRFGRFGGRVLPDHDGGHPLVRFLFVILVIALIVIGIALLVRALSSGSRSARDARHVLDDRFARGEIDETEYRNRRAALGS